MKHLDQEVEQMAELQLQSQNLAALQQEALQKEQEREPVPEEVLQSLGRTLAAYLAANALHLPEERRRGWKRGVRRWRLSPKDTFCKPLALTLGEDGSLGVAKRVSLHSQLLFELPVSTLIFAVMFSALGAPPIMPLLLGACSALCWGIGIQQWRASQTFPSEWQEGEMGLTSHQVAEILATNIEEARQKMKSTEAQLRHKIDAVEKPLYERVLKEA